MRFEDLSFAEKIHNLQKFHKSLNKNLFNGELSNVMMDIRNLKNADPCVAVFHPGAILFDLNFYDLMDSCATQKKQACCAAQIILHEMIHQYIHEKGLKDSSDHGAVFQREAEAHGLHSIYENECIKEERLTLIGCVAIENFRFTGKK